MKVLTSKIVNGKKMFLIEDNNPQGKVFAQDGKPIKKENISNYNPYYVDVRGLNASESTKTNLTPATKITPQEIKKIKESPTNVGNIKIKEAQEKAQRLKEAEEAYKKRKAGVSITPELLAQETQAIGDKISLQNIPGVGQYIPDILDVTGGIGSMASGLGAIPLNLNRGNYAQALLSVVMPLGVGALAGIGNPNTGQFANNLINPFAGTGQIINKLGNKYLPNAYKLNPFAFRTSPEKFYRQVDNVTYNEGLESGLIRGKQDINRTNGEGIINMNKYFGDDAYYNKGSLYYKNNKNLPYLFEANLGEDKFIPKVNGRTRKYTTENTSVRVSKEPLSINDPNITTYKKDWLKGYKQTDAPKQQFKSEIDWAKWNKEIPKKAKRIDEYNAIEQASKAKGTWMKYSDGSEFKGTPEQFIQMNHLNTQKFAGSAKASEQMYKENLHRGSHQHIDDFKNRDADQWATFLTDSKVNAETYAGSDGLTKTYYHPDVDGSGEWVDGIYQLGFPQNLPKVVGNAEGRNWRLLDYDSKIAEGVQFPKMVKDHNKALREAETLKDYGLKNVDNSKDYLSTDIYASYIKNPKNSEAIAKIQRVIDQMGSKPNIPENTVYAIDANRVPLKSLRHNNGDFEITNPNIYKTLIPGAMTLGALNQTNKKQFGGTIKVLDTKIEKNKKYYLINE